MANTTDGRSHNQPSHEAQVKGGEHSHSGSTANKENDPSSSDSSSRGSTSHTAPSHEASVKGGEHSQGGSK